jgi:hypothetical protein
MPEKSPLITLTVSPFLIGRFLKPYLALRSSDSGAERNFRLL